MGKKKQSDYKNTREFPTAGSYEERIGQLHALNLDLMEYRLRNGLASSAETTSLLRLITEDARLRREQLQEQNALIRSKTDAISSQTEVTNMIKAGFEAFSSYSPGGDDENENPYRAY